MINVTKISTKQFTANLGEKSDTSKKKESTTFSPNIKKTGHVVIILTNFYEDWIEIGDFLPMSNFRMCLIFLP